jgi:peptidyl-prolyl cis-trans isomerase D
VTAPELAAHLAGLAGSQVGGRLGLSPDGTFGAEEGRREEAIRSWATRGLLLERLADQEAARLGVTRPESPDDWAERLEAAGELRLSPPSEADALQCYLANHCRYRVLEARRVRHLLLADQRDAQDLFGETAGGRVLADLAAKSLDEGSRFRGGDLGWVERGQLAGSLEDAIFAAAPGEVCGPVESPFGWHVLIVEAVRPEHVRPFAECRDEILRELTADRHKAAWQEWWQRRVAEAIAVADGTLDIFARGLPGTSHRH